MSEGYHCIEEGDDRCTHPWQHEDEDLVVESPPPTARCFQKRNPPQVSDKKRARVDTVTVVDPPNGNAIVGLQEVLARDMEFEVPDLEAFFNSFDLPLPYSSRATICRAYASYASSLVPKPATTASSAVKKAASASTASRKK